MSVGAWQRLTDEAVRILCCQRCAAAGGGAASQPFWVGDAYEPGGVVLVGRNPAGKPLPEPALQLLGRLRNEPSVAAFLDWSRWRIAHMTSTPWTQWRRAFAKVIDGFCTPKRLAWLNVVPFPTPGDARPSSAMLAHGRDEHLAPMLTEVLRPSIVVARYVDAARAVAAIGGPWQADGLRALTGRNADPHEIEAARAALRTHGLRDHAPAASPPGRPTLGGVPSPMGPVPAGPEDGRAALRGNLLGALTEVSGFPPIERASYTSVGDAPIWAFVDRLAAKVQVKFRVATPYRAAETIRARLVAKGVDATVEQVRSGPGSVRLWARLDGPADLAALRQELPALWRDYQQLRD